MKEPSPVISSINKPYWDGLKRGHLLFQVCARCGHRWLPPRDACPSCLAPHPEWRPSAGHGTVISWVVYHTAYDPAFEDRIPYNVSIVELVEGPRMLTNVVGPDANTRLTIGAPVTLSIEQSGDLAIPKFRLVG